MFDDSVFDFSIFTLNTAKQINDSLYSDFLNISHGDNIKRTHLFNGRYENLYIEKSSIPTITPILNFANSCAKKLLNSDQELDIGYWFNDMPPESITIPHTHDDDDELLSGAYYVKVPENSGNLILTKNKIHKTITPVEGQLILFKPDCLHEVTKNNCSSHRLSIGMNFGIKKS